jgi:predicted metalloprotease with PDZ domain
MKIAMARVTLASGMMTRFGFGFSCWATALAALALGLCPFASAQDIRQPEPAAMPAPIAAPRDVPFQGTIDLALDVTDVQRRIVNVHEKIPVQAGEITLLYPQWIPGNHSPTGPISKLAGLVVTGNGKKIQWIRDRVNVYAFHITVPSGVETLDLQFQFLGPMRTSQGRISFSSKILDLAWNTAVLYPAGYFSRQIQFAPSIKLPAGWHFASALEVSSQAGDVVHFKDTPLNTLIDSPVYAGANYKRLDLSTGPDNQVFLDVFADSAANLAITPEQLQLHRNMVREAQKLYASHHYNHYDFLFLLSDTVGGIGLEHHQSSEDGTHSNYFTDWVAGIAGRDLLAHEYTHSWNGKFRRPADLWTANFNVPMQDDLLWVYEGMTQYFGYVLTTRSGLRTADQTRDLIARVAANFDVSPGRDWRPLVDTTNQPTMSQRSPVTWVSWQRPEDYYTEGMLIWLDADTKIRELSGDNKSLDDFAKLFFGIDNGSFITQTYTLDDVVAVLNKVQPYDWASFLKERVYELDPHTPEAGITRGGYRLTYTDTEPEWMKHEGRPDMPVNLSTSIGLSVKADGNIDNVWWDSPAFQAGIMPDMQITAVNGTAFKVDVLKTAITDAEKNESPMKFLLKRGDQFETIELNYHGGLRYPKLERVASAPDRLDAILAPGK